MAPLRIILLVPWLAAACAPPGAGRPALTAPSPTVAVVAPSAAPGPASAPAASEAAAPLYSVPVQYRKLANGLRVVLSPDHSAPVVLLGVYYGVGFRLEPRGRTGFAHLFEHMMFQGSLNLGKGELSRLVQASGGILNGSTRFDFTAFWEIAPASTLESLLWAEADRMWGLDVTEESLANQKSVVSTEVKVNVLNRPAGGFPWLDLPQLANQRWPNAHDFYGDLADLEAAKLDEMKAFFRTYYVPSNAVVVVVGDVEAADGLAVVERYFGGIPSGVRPAAVDVAEPRQEQERRSRRVDRQGKRPGLALGWHMPPRGTPEATAMLLLQEILASGDDSLLHQALVAERGLTGEVESAINELGNPWNYAGPMTLDVWMFHDAERKADDLVAVVDAQVARLRTAPVDDVTLARAVVKARAAFYDALADTAGLGKLDLLATFALFDDDPTRINTIDEQLRAVTPELLLRTAQEYLRPENRSILTLEVAP